MKLSLVVAVIVSVTTFACASAPDDAQSSDSDIIAPPAPAPARRCGVGITGIAIVCEADETCDYSGLACGAADAMGTCKPKGAFCPAIVLPVCSCDGKTYGNGCEAAREGARIAHEGACEAAK